MSGQRDIDILCNIVFFLLFRHLIVKLLERYVVPLGPLAISSLAFLFKNLRRVWYLEFLKQRGQKILSRHL